MIEHKEYKTLYEALKVLNKIPSGYQIGMVTSSQFLNTVKSLFSLSTETTTTLSSTEANQLWCSYIIPRYLESYIGSIDLEASGGNDDKTQSIFYDWMIRYMSILNRTYDTYKILIDTLTANKTALMNGVQATRVSKFNDTPQVTDGSLANDNYVTNITQDVSTNDLVTKMARIAEIEEKLNNYYTLWANEFGGIFIYD